MSVFAQPALWMDFDLNTPPMWWEALEADGRWWFYNNTGSLGGSTGTIIDAASGPVTLDEDVTLAWEVVEPSSTHQEWSVTVRDAQSTVVFSATIPTDAVGTGEFTIPANTEVASWLVEQNSSRVYNGIVAIGEAAPPPVPTCQELGRATRAYVSAYDRSRVHQSRLYRFEKRCFVANFNGAIPPARTITRATWRIDCPEVGVISSPSISANGRETAVMFAAQLCGWATLRAEVTLDNGEIYNQVFRVNVREASWFKDDLALTSGPYSVSTCVVEVDSELL
jgi:hypothetical protein